MLSKVRNVVTGFMYKYDEADKPTPRPQKPEKFVYTRPYFLGLNREEVQGSRDYGIRPILIPRDVGKIPWSAGYAECINGGKSDFNEDQAFAAQLCLRQSQDKCNTSSSNITTPPGNHPGANGPVPMLDIAAREMTVPVSASYYGIFDGHAGYSAALIASRLMHKHVQEKLEPCLTLIQQLSHGTTPPELDTSQISVDDLVTGAFELAFSEMDNQLEREGDRYLIKGGCTALVALMFNGKLYVANAGDCRAVLSHGGKVTRMSHDFTPESERHRLNYLGHLQPELLHNEFCCVDFLRRINKCDVGTRVLCRQPGMLGWSYKIVTEDDAKFPLVIGTGKRARVMGTIGVTRGLGDHDLYVFDSSIGIKPFLSCKPEVRVLDLSESSLTDSDVLIMASDGLWDVMSNETAADIVNKSLASTDKDDYKKYTIAAQELVLEARGLFTGRGWRKKDDEPASFDDITVFLIPLKPYTDRWKDGPPLEDSIS